MAEGSSQGDLTRGREPGVEISMEKAFSSRWFHIVSFVVISAAVLLAYSNSFGVPFQFDGVPQIEENRGIRALYNLVSIFRSTRPVTMLTFALNYAIGGLDTFGYHVVNVAIHIINAFLAYLFVLMTLGLLTEKAPWARRMAFFSALLFAVHPLQTQAVTYIIQRMESLGSLFYLAGLIFFILAARGKRGEELATEEHSKSPAGRKAVPLLLYSCSIIAYVIGFYSKEIIITLPAVVFLYDIFFLRGAGFGSVLRRAPYYAVMASLMVFFAVSSIAPQGGFGDVSEESVVAGAAEKTAGADTVAQLSGQEQRVPVAASEELKKSGKGPSAGFGVSSISPKEYLFTQFNVQVYYLTLLLYPANQNLDYHYPISESLFEVPVVPPGTALNFSPPPPVVSFVILLTMLVVSIWLAVMWRGGKRGAEVALPVSFFILWFFIILAPTSSFVPIIDVLFEHRVYLPSLGFFTIAVILFDRFVDIIVRRILDLSPSRTPL